LQFYQSFASVKFVANNNDINNNITTKMITTEDDQLRIEYPDIIYDPSTPTTHHGYNQPLVYFERCILLSSSINKHCENNLN
jgi:hypothetical protein